MADYYPLISRAVAALEKNSGENRRALYERARAALLAQLRGVTPPLDESDITRERLALEESIRKVEAESARQFVETSRQTPASKIRSMASRPADSRPREEPPAPKTPSPEAAPVEPHQRKEVEPPAPPPQRYVNPPAQAAQETARATPQQDARRPWPSPAAPDPRYQDALVDQPPPPEPAPQTPSSQARNLLRRLAGERRPRSNVEPVVAAPPPAADLERPARPFDRPQLERSEPPIFDRQAPQERMFERPVPPEPQERMFERPVPSEPQERMFERAVPHEPQERVFEPRVPYQPQERGFEPQAPREPRPRQDFSEPMLESSFPFDDSHPAPGKERRGPPPPLEDDLEFEPDEDVAPRRSYRDLIRGLAVAVVIIGIGGLLLWQWPNLVEFYRSFRAPAVETARDAPPAATRPKITDRIEPGTQQAPATPAPVPGAQPAAAQKVVLYEEDPADPNGKRFVGSAIWRTETVTPGPGQPPELAIRADVEVPERKLAMTWSLRRNTDKGLPATHTVEIMFKLPADFPAGGISNVPGILMKQAEQTRGVPLAGLAVKVTPAFYLIGLSNMDADKDRNIQLLKERAWFDIPVVYNNNRRAILAMEKGSPGERAFADAFKAWKQ
jgi:hypothetical protein